MKNMKVRYAICMAVMIGLISCTQQRTGNSVTEEPKPTIAREIKLGDNTIDIQHVTSEGRLQSFNLTPIYSLVDGVIRDFNLQDGMAVRKGEVLMRIDDSALKMKIAELEADLKRMEYEVENMLIGLGYLKEDFDKIPQDMRNNVEILTGYQAAIVKLNNLRAQQKSHVITAPFSGSIIKVNMTKMGYARCGDTMFYLLDTEHLKLEFRVIEKLLPQFKLGMEISFSTLQSNNTSYKARLIAIAPNVEEDGMIKMTAEVIGSHPELRSGMTVLVNL